MNLHPSTRAVYASIRAWWGAHGHAPSYREIAASCGLSSTSVAAYHVTQLERRGLLRRDALAWPRHSPVRTLVPLDALGHPAVGRPNYERVAQIAVHGDGTPIWAWRLTP